MNLEKLIAEIKREVGALGQPTPHVCAPLCYCGSVPTTRSETQALQKRVQKLEAALAQHEPTNRGRLYAVPDLAVSRRSGAR